MNKYRRHQVLTWQPPRRAKDIEAQLPQKVSVHRVYLPDNFGTWRYDIWHTDYVEGKAVAALKIVDESELE